MGEFRQTMFSDPDLTDVHFAPKLGVDLSAMTRTDSGLRYRDLVVGRGTEAQTALEVTVHYTGWLPDGAKFDSSKDRKTCFVFRLGDGMVIGGWDEGVAGMRVGGRRKLVIPPSLGYGTRAVGPIPPNSVLVFDVDLLGVK